MFIQIQEKFCTFPAILLRIELFSQFKVSFSGIVFISEQFPTLTHKLFVHICIETIKVFIDIVENVLIRRYIECDGQTTPKRFNIPIGVTNMWNKMGQDPKLVSCPLQKGFIHINSIWLGLRALLLSVNLHQ